MKILITAGNTQSFIDRVRCITNIFTGRTGTNIALHAHQLGHQVTLLTSHPEVINQLRRPDHSLQNSWQVIPYRTFEDLQQLMAQHIREFNPDVLIHSAAVSDYQTAGIFAPGPGTKFNTENNSWETTGLTPPQLVDRGASKVKSSEPELWLRLVQTPKLVDLVRQDWGFRGVLVKFKLEVGISEEQLVRIAEESRLQSQADLMVANTLEGAQDWAYLGPLAGKYHRVDRPLLPEKLLAAVEKIWQEMGNG